MAETDWTRQRKLPFARVLALILRGHKLPIQNTRNTVFGTLDALDQLPTASAYCQARRKLKPDVFLYLNRIVTDHMDQSGTSRAPIKTWHGRRLLAADGTYLNLPDTPDTRARYSLQENQWDGGACVQALASVLYDLLNNLGLNATLDTKRAEKDFLFEQHAACMKEGDVIVLDRLYADSAVLAFWQGHRRDFVIRFPHGRFKQVHAFWASNATDRLVDIEVTGKQRRFVRDRGLPEVIRIRLVKVELDSGEIEVLGTSLFDQAMYSRADLKQVYGWRWGVETYFDRLKNVFDLERWSGTSIHSIEQDFYGIVFLATLESVLSMPAEAELADESRAKGHRHVQHVNQVVRYGTMLDHVVALLIDHRTSVEVTLQKLHRLFKTNPSRSRTGRKVPRTKATPSQRLRFYRYTKRCVA